MNRKKTLASFALIFGGLITATSAVAKPPVLSPPLDCALGEACFIQNYVDTDPSSGAADFTCGALAYDGHKGTDFALPLRSDIWSDVDVFAAAPGTVKATRDGMIDFPQGTEGAPDVTNKECGNAVEVDHGDGWVTRYCHLKKGSVFVRKGDKVNTSTVLGYVGLSGQTQFPHVHISVRKDGKVIDPFNPSGTIACGSEGDTAQTLWKTPLPYAAGGLIDIGFASEIPQYSDVQAGTASRTSFRTSAPALVAFALAFGGKTGDVLHFQVSGPQGVLIDKEVVTDKNQAQLMRAVGKKNRGLWAPGIYTATVTMTRDGTVLGERSESFIVTR